MKLWWPFLTVLVLAVKSQVIFTPSANACGTDGSGFLPENTMKIPVTMAHLAMVTGKMNQAIFDSVLDKVSSYYSPIVSAKGATLNIQHLWSDSTVNAYAERNGNQWNVKIYGGLARHDATTADGLALVACHELGHHLGGVPRYSGQWAANEGQSDYFAVLKCLRRVWETEDNVAMMNGISVPDAVVKSCEKQNSDAAKIALCERIAMAGLSSANLSKALDGSLSVDFTTPDPAVVQQTFDSHPKAQCRLDTYYQGTLCHVDFKDEIGQDDPTVGTCSVEKNDTVGTRPLCWYKPGSSGTGGGGGGPSGAAPAPSIGGQMDVWVHSPYQWVLVQYNVSSIAQATGVYFEMSRPNVPLNPPNSNVPDPAHLFYALQRGTMGSFSVLPIRDLPGWGLYQYRVVAMGGNGTFPVSVFSNASTLRLSP